MRSLLDTFMICRSMMIPGYVSGVGDGVMSQVMIISEEESQQVFPVMLDIALLVVALASTLISLLVPCLYYLKRECRQHPTVLIANISLLESIANFNIVLMAVNIFTIERVLDIKSIFHLLTFDLVHLTSTDENTDFCVYNYWMYMLVELMSLSFHLCYAVDLLLTLKFPFLAGSKRRNYYYALSLLFPALALGVSGEEAFDICTQELASESVYKVPFFFLVGVLAFMGVSVAIVLVSFLQRRSPAKIRRNYIKQHRIVLSLLVLLWVAPVWSNILLLIGAHDSLLFQVLNKIAFFSILASTGVVNIARMVFDKYLRQRIARMLCLGSRRNTAESQRRANREEQNEEEAKEEITNEMWNLPLSGAMREFHSQEIVHNIIQVVCEACSAHATRNSQSHLHESHVRDDVSTPSVSASSVSHNTIIIDQEFQSGQNSLSRMFLRRQQHRYQRIDPQECGLDQLKELARRNRKFHMVCLPHEQALGNKTVHMRSKVEGEEGQMLSIWVTSYSHRIFEALRASDGFSPTRISQTLDLGRNIEAVKAAKESMGASGSFFFFSYDHRMVIKTISEQEKDRFLALLPAYYDHLRYNHDSLLARTYGLFAVEIAGISKIYFQLMENTFGQLQRAGVTFRAYDLKGSTVQREVRNPSASVQKDIDYFNSPDCFLFLTRDSRLRLLDQIEKDAGMLRRHNIMDYSLLLAVGRSNTQPRRRELYARGVEGRRGENFRCLGELQELTRRIYSVSLIDYLQEYNLSKKMELWFKRIFKGGGDISSIATGPYYRRFMQMVQRIVITCEVKFHSESSMRKTA